MTSFLLGPVYQPPTGLISSDVVNSAATKLSNHLYHVLQNGRSDSVNFEPNSSSVSVTAMSTQDDNSPFFDFHFSSPQLNTTAGGTNKVTNASIYRIGSISKLFTVYMMLVNFGWKHWDDSVTRFIPELAKSTNDHTSSPIEHVNWDEVTIGSLASQLSGAGRDYANGDLASQNLPWSKLGLPELPSSEIPHCAGNYSLPPCSRHEFFQGVAIRHPTFAPQTTPVYSNLAYRTLGYVLEALSGTSYSRLLRSSVLEPLGLANTVAKVPSSKGSWVIPNGDTGFFQDVGDEMPTAGMYSSSYDLAKLGRNILLSKQLSPLDTRRWMKPMSHTASLSLSVGSPWEIWRTRSQVSHGRTIDLYTKSGSLGQYNSHLILVPDYGITFSILTAGPSSSSVVKIVAGTVLRALLPILESVSISEACKAMCGTYESRDSSRNSSIEIGSDESGLLVTRWINRGVDVKKTITDYAIETGSAPIKWIRLQTTNLDSISKLSNEKDGTRRVAYRALFEADNSDLTKSPRIMDPGDTHWSSMDSPTYGDIAADDFVIELNQSGVAMKVEPRIIRDELHRVTK
ncbi:beta-lactamase/transpeptidase-like protein [Mariannaea sp. PMI_226]|nr:beta-lactamase/transpeptidase-like protein [Mariannaea sp. PMI_226]